MDAAPPSGFVNTSREYRQGVLTALSHGGWDAGLEQAALAAAQRLARARQATFTPHVGRALLAAARTLLFVVAPLLLAVPLWHSRWALAVAPADRPGRHGPLRRRRHPARSGARLLPAGPPPQRDLRPCARAAPADGIQRVPPLAPRSSQARAGDHRSEALRRRAQGRDDASRSLVARSLSRAGAPAAASRGQGRRGAAAHPARDVSDHPAAVHGPGRAPVQRGVLGRAARLAEARNLDLDDRLGHLPRAALCVVAGAAGVLSDRADPSATPSRSTCSRRT